LLWYLGFQSVAHHGIVHKYIQQKRFLISEVQCYPMVLFATTTLRFKCVCVI